MSDAPFPVECRAFLQRGPSRAVQKMEKTMFQITPSHLQTKTDYQLSSLFNQAQTGLRAKPTDEVSQRKLLAVRRMIMDELTRRMSLE